MQLKKLLESDDAVSPVIGVILMVAITVILAAVIGTFVLGLGDQVQQTSPNAQFSFDYTADGGNQNSGLLDITHDGGDGISQDQLTVRNGAVELNASNGNYNANDWFNSTDVTAGDSAALHNDTSVDGNTVNLDDNSVSVIWNAPDGDRSSKLAEWEQ